MLQVDGYVFEEDDLPSNKMQAIHQQHRLQSFKFIGTISPPVLSCSKVQPPNGHQQNVGHLQNPLLTQGNSQPRREPSPAGLATIPMQTGSGAELPECLWSPSTSVRNFHKLSQSKKDPRKLQPLMTPPEITFRSDSKFMKQMKLQYVHII